MELADPQTAHIFHESIVRSEMHEIPRNTEFSKIVPRILEHPRDAVASAEEIEGPVIASRQMAVDQQDFSFDSGSGMKRAGQGN